MTFRVPAIVTVMLLCVACSACTPPVDVIPFTSGTFPPKASGEHVAVLHEKPTRPFLEIAELDVHSTMVGFERLERALLDRAAQLGADAVILSDSETSVQGGGGKRQGSGPMESSSAAAPQSAYTIKSLRGFAIRYTEEDFKR